MVTTTLPLAWAGRRRHVAAVLIGMALLAAWLEALLYAVTGAAAAVRMGLVESFLRLWQPWLLAALLALLVRELVVRRWLVVGSRWGTILLHTGVGVLFPLLHLYLLAVVQRTLFPLERPSIGPAFVDLLKSYSVQGAALYAATAAAFYAVEFATTASRQERQALQLKASLAEARLAALHHQLHPHFLFNALNTIGMLIRQSRPDDALTMLAAFGGLMRDLLRESPDHEVSLTEELDFVRRYLEVERMRFPDRLDIAVTCDAPGDLRVPALILQPLVENAVRHGVARQAARGRIAVTARNAGAALELVVEDNGPGLAGPPAPGLPGGVGLANVRARLAHHYGEAAELRVTDGPRGGVTAMVRLPPHVRRNERVA